MLIYSLEYDRMESNDPERGKCTVRILHADSVFSEVIVCNVGWFLITTKRGHRKVFIKESLVKVMSNKYENLRSTL